MTRFLTLPPSLLPFPPSFSPFQRKWGGRRVIKLRVRSSTEPGGEPEPESEPGNYNMSSSSSRSNWTNSWCAGLGGLGFIETSYLTYLKLTDSDAFCPVEGGTCGDVLTSGYASVFGVPLPLIGMFAYGLVTIISLQISGKRFLFEIDENIGRLILLGTTTSMATDFGLQEIQKRVGLQLCLGGLVIAILSTSYSSSQSAAISSADVELQPFTTEITTESSPLALALARHLHSVGAKMYGAFWCSHCFEQKEMFGRDAAKLLDYVECFPSGYKKGIKIEKACSDAGIEGFPTWIINGEVLSGDQELSELARVSGFKLDNFVPAE